MIQEFLKAGYPALVVLTQEPVRAEELLVCEGWRFFAWDCIQGIKDLQESRIIEEIHDPVEAIKWLHHQSDTVLLAHNLHLFMDIPEVIQAVSNGYRWKSTGSALVIIAPQVAMRPELEKFFHILEMPLPTEEELFNLQLDMSKNLNINPNRKAARLGRGLTEFQCETAYALSLIRKGYYSSKIVTSTKEQMLRKLSAIQVIQPEAIKNVGGLGQLKNFIKNRSKAFSQENVALPRVKGVLLVGVPGTGKSLASSASAHMLQWPLIRLDIGSLKNSLVGESERRMRQATQVIEAFGQSVVVWIDEVEKAFAGIKSSGESDGGTTSSMFGWFLTWLNETTAPVLVMATANDISQLPAEFMRAGRFDATFFVDLPTAIERKEIIKIVNRKWGSDIPLNYVDRLAGYTGSEIEQLGKDSLFDGLENAYKNLVPLSRSNREQISSLREWAKTRARLANTLDEEPKTQRKIRAVKGS